MPQRHTFRLVTSLAILISLVSCSSTQWSVNAPDAQQMMTDITYLASDELQGRDFASKGEMLAADYIARRFKKLGLKPAGEDGTWFQSVQGKAIDHHGVMIKDPEQQVKSIGQNVIGMLNHGAEYTLVFGAHYDHLGYGPSGSLHTGEPAIHNGADDNASGVAMMMELAQRLENVKSLNFVFIALTGEEKGLWGSNYFCDHPTINLVRVTAMINFDMVGRLENDQLAINGTGTSPDWPAMLNQANKHNLTLTMTESGVGPSDHTSFYLEDIPVLHFFTGAHEDYHRPSDDVEKINAAGMVIITDMVTDLALQIAAKGNEKLPFSKTKDPDPTSSPRMEVTLGVIPDYLFDGTGMRIDGVREGKPAAAAGMAKGDVIIKMAGKEIKDIYAYMEVLGTLHAGDKTTVIVKRNEKEVELNVQF